MDPKQAYDFWASLYDSNKNNTRDLEAVALRETLSRIHFNSCLEIGCGTGKNTLWLKDRAEKITAVDLSFEMLAKARAKINEPGVQFMQADINAEWDFTQSTFDLVGFSLVLEHIQFLEPVFRKCYSVLEPGGYVYVGELHPFKQYTGTRARFDDENGRHEVECYTHHSSDFINAAKTAGLELVDLNEYFDNTNHHEIPRILVLIFRKPIL